MHKVNILLKVIICSVLFSGLFMMNACKSDSPNEKEKTEKAAKKGAKKGAKGKNNKAKTGKTVNNKYKNVTAQAFKLRMEKQKGAVILDCRTPKEFKAGSVPGAKNINFRDKNFAKQIAALDKSKGTTCIANREDEVKKLLWRWRMLDSKKYLM